MRSARHLALIVLPLALSCARSSGEASSSGADALIEAKIWKGPELFSCALEVIQEGGGFFGAHRVVCTSNIPSDFPISVRGSINITDKTNNTRGASLTDLATAPLVFNAFDDRFPVKVKVDVFTSQGSAQVVNLPRNAALSVERSFDVTTKTPFTAKLPFDVWPVTVIGREASFVGRIPERSIDLGGLTSQGQPTFMTAPSSLHASLGETKQAFFVVGEGSKLEGAADFNGKNLPFTIDAPGTYAAFADGLRAVDTSQPPSTTHGVSFGACTAQGLDVLCAVDEASGVAVTAATVRYVDGDVTTDAVALPNVLPVPDLTKGSVLASFKIDPANLTGLPTYIAQQELALSLSVADIVAGQRNQFSLPFETLTATLSAAPNMLLILTVPERVVPLTSAWHTVSSFRAEMGFVDVQAVNGERKAIIPVGAGVDSISTTALLLNVVTAEQKEIPFELTRGRSYLATPTEILDITP